MYYASNSPVVSLDNTPKRVRNLLHTVIQICYYPFTHKKQ